MFSISDVILHFTSNRGACDSNEQHDTEFTSERSAAEQDMMTNIEDTLQHVDSESIIYSKVILFEIVILIRVDVLQY